MKNNHQFSSPTILLAKDSPKNNCIGESSQVEVVQDSTNLEIQHFRKMESEYIRKFAYLHERKNHHL